MAVDLHHAVNVHAVLVIGRIHTPIRLDAIHFQRDVQRFGHAFVVRQVNHLIVSADVQAFIYRKLDFFRCGGCQRAARRLYRHPRRIVGDGVIFGVAALVHRFHREGQRFVHVFHQIDFILTPLQLVAIDVSRPRNRRSNGVAVQVAHLRHGEGHGGLFDLRRIFLQGDDERIIVHHEVEQQVYHTALVFHRRNGRSHEGIFHRHAVGCRDGSKFHFPNYRNGIGVRRSRRSRNLVVGQRELHLRNAAVDDMLFKRIVGKQSHFRSVQAVRHACLHGIFILVQAPETDIVQASVEITHVSIGQAVHGYRGDTRINVSRSNPSIARGRSVNHQCAIHIKLRTIGHAVHSHRYMVPIVVQIIAAA